MLCYLSNVFKQMNFTSCPSFLVLSRWVICNTLLVTTKSRRSAICFPDQLGQYFRNLKIHKNPSMASQYIYNKIQICCHVLRGPVRPGHRLHLQLDKSLLNSLIPTRVTFLFLIYTKQLPAPWALHLLFILEHYYQSFPHD